MKNKGGGGKSSSRKDAATEDEGGSLAADDQQKKMVRRRWHVPQQTDITSPYSKSLSRKASQHSADAQGGRELRTVTSTTASQSPLHADACRLFSRKQKKTADADAVGGNHPADSSLPVTFQDDERNAANEEEDYVEDANLSEAALFASEVKRFSKESSRRVLKQVKKKIGRFLENPGFASNSMDGGDGFENEDYDDSKRRRKGAMALFWLEMILPCVGWMRTYKFKEFLAADVIAGCSVAMMVIPQSISYAALAGLPSEFGLYTALVPVFVYALFGSSRQLAVGPVAIVSLLMKEGLHKAIPASLAIQDPNNPQGEEQVQAQLQYSLMAVQITFVVGVIEFGMGLVRLGFLTNFLSHSVILGFTHGSAIIIGLSQLKHVIGIKAQNAKGTMQDMIKAYIDAGNTFDWRVLIMGLAFLAMLITMKEIGKRAGSNSPLKWFRTVGPITTSVLGIVICYAARLDKYGIPLVGKFAGGFPSVTYQELFPMPSVGAEFITNAFACAIVGLLESVSIAKRLAAKNKYHLYANQELRALGLSNLAGAGFSAYPATGSFSRSAVSNDTGCKTQLGGCFTAVIVLLVVLFATKPFYYMPTSALGAIVISGVLGLLDFEEALYLFRLSKLDFLVWMASFFGTLFLGAELGLAIAIGLALLIVIYQSAFPQIVELGRLQGTTIYRNMKQYPHAKRFSSVIILRVGAPIYFANCSYVREVFEYSLEKHERLGHTVKVVIMEMSPVSHVDATAMHVLKEMMEDFVETRGLRFMIANPNPQVMRSLQHDEKIWELLNPCDPCLTEESPSLPSNIERLPDSIDETLRDKTTLYYGSHNSNLFVRVHDAVKESVLYLKEKVKMDGSYEDIRESINLDGFVQEAERFFSDLTSIKDSPSSPYSRGPSLDISPVIRE